MRSRSVIFSPEARNDLLALDEWVASASDEATAMNYIERLSAYCSGFSHASERGRLRGDLRPGLRIVGFERRATIAFSVDDDTVTILRIFYGGRNWEADLTPAPPDSP